MRSTIVLVGVAGLSLTNAQAQTISMGEIEHRDAMAVAERLLPADIRPQVVEGVLRREFLPGNIFWAGYRTKPRPVGTDMCEQTLYSVQLRGTAPPSASPNSGSELTIAPVQRRELHALVFPARKAGADSCAVAKGFVDLSGREGERQTAAYRLLVQAVRAARAPEPLPFGLRCAPAEDAACRDARAALANLPLEVLHRIEVSSGLSDVLSDGGGVRLIQQRPIGREQAYDVTFAFGMSGTDGRSWRVSWVQDRDGPSEVLLTRTLVISH